MLKFVVLIVMLTIVVPAWGGEKEDLALRIFTLQEEVQVLQDQFKSKQTAYQKAREALKKESDQGKKGTTAVSVLKQEEELIELANKVNAKTAEQNAAREKFRALVDKK